MEEQKNIFTYIGGLFATYGVIVAIFIVLNLVVGKEASDYSTLFSYGRGGLSIPTLLQLFALSFIISICRNLLFTDRWIREMPMLLRNVIFFGLIMLSTVAFVIAFAWFPVSDIKAWVGFLLSFTLCSALGVWISRIRERAENDKMNRALEKYNG